LKQQGHDHDLNCVSYSPNGQLMASGGDDGKIKLWNNDTGYCFVTFNEHAGPITGTTFTSRGNVVLSSSLDGTVRAFDLVRYRNFRTLTTPAEDTSAIVQLTCVACDPSGDIICAGSMDPFNIYVWSLRTSKLLDVLKAHEGPISCVAFSAARVIIF
jgi:periodic tryptophan protein 2